jgi:hypothetical protein
VLSVGELDVSPGWLLVIVLWIYDVDGDASDSDANDSGDDDDIAAD